MPRRARNTPAGYVYHVMNRAAGRVKMFRKEADLQAFEQVLLEAHEHEPLPILAYVAMGDHWRLVVKPADDEQITRFFRWLTVAHAMRWHVAHGTMGTGHLYQGRFKAFVVQENVKMLDVVRHVERAPLAAGLVKRAQNWQWSSLWARANREAPISQILSAWPTKRPSDWVERVNKPADPKLTARLEISEARERPYGDDEWVAKTVKAVGLEHTMRSPGRPRGTAKS